MTVSKKFAISGNSQLLDGGAMFGNAPRELWQKWMTPDELNRIPLACRSFLFVIDGKLFLLEAGIGAFFDPKMRERFGVKESEHCLLKNLARLGIQETDIDYVLLSHLHFDHAGGLLPVWGSKSEQLHFPNAKYVVSRVAFERSLHPHFRDRASFIPGLADKLTASGRLILVDGQSHADVAPDTIQFLFSDGHTPGQMHTLIHDGDRRYLFAGDLIPGTAWVHLPITMGYDRFAEKVIDEKQHLYESQPLAELVLLYTHDAHYAASSVQRDEAGRYQAINPLVQLDES